MELLNHFNISVGRNIKVGRGLTCGLRSSGICGTVDGCVHFLSNVILKEKPCRALVGASLGLHLWNKLIEGSVHCSHQHGEADQEEEEDCHELSQVHQQTRDDDSPGPEHVVELEKVEDLDHAEEKRPGQELIPDVEKYVGVFSRDQEQRQVEADRHRSEKYYDRSAE